MIGKSILLVLGIMGSVPPSGAGVIYRGHYSNVDYGFEITIPPGFTGQGAAPGAPNHGFVIQTKDGSTILVEARYDVSVDSDGENFEQTVRRSHGPPNAKLGGLPAWDSNVIPGEAAPTNTGNGITARYVSKQGDAIIYTITENHSSSRGHDASDALYKKLVRSFRLIPIQ